MLPGAMDSGMSLCGSGALRAKGVDKVLEFAAQLGPLPGQGRFRRAQTVEWVGVRSGDGVVEGLPDDVTAEH